MSSSKFMHLVTGVALLAPTTNAYAQEAADTNPANKIEEIVVTGTNIRGVDLAPVVNIQPIDRAQLEESGAAQMADLIKEIPSNAGTTQYNENGQLSGTAQFELRGLGFSSTLVLLNGRRAGVAPLSDKSGADFVDINQFPLAMVERLDVLKDGSSAIYGSEAVAGVVNIITRKGFDGIELSTDYSSSTNDAYSLNLASGHTFDRGSFNFYATYYHQTGNTRTDFPWLVARVGGNGTPGYSQLINNNGFPATFSLATFNAAGKPTAVTGATNVPDPNCLQAGGVFAIGANGVTNTTTCDFNFADQIGVIPDEHRVQSFFEADYDLTDDLKFFNETGASRNVNYITENPGSFSNGTAVGGLTYVPASAPFNFFIADPSNPKNIIAVNPAQWNPAVDQAVPVVANLRPQGSYITAQKRQTDMYIRTVNGVDWSFGDKWHATISHEFAYAEYQELNPLGVNATALNALVANGQYNPFGTSVTNPTLVSPKDGVSVAGNSQAVLNQIFYTSDLDRRTEQNVVDASASGPIIDLPTGPISIAVGAQYRRQTLNYVPDSINAAGLGTAATTDAPFSGAEHVWSEYAEAIIPYNDLAQIQAAVRHEDYGAGTGSTTDPKFTGRLNLFSGLLGLRGSWGTSFQAPTLQQDSTSQIIQIVNDPVVSGPSGLLCSATTTGSGVTVVTTGGGLKPQTSTNYDLGADFKPLSALTFTTDFWHYNYSNLIASGQNAQAIISGECVNGHFVNDPRVVRSPNGLPLTVSSSYVNVGKVIADGVDFSATYAAPTFGFGDVKFRMDATYLNDFDVSGANGVVTHDAGSRNFNNNFAPMPRWRGSAHAVWTEDVHEVSMGVNFTGGYRNDQDFNAPISSFTTVDLQYALHLDKLLGEKSWSTVLAVGMNNMFDADPPALTRYTSAGVFVTGPTAIDRPGYDALSGANIQGRIIFARLKQNF